MRTIVITGGTGFIGTKLINKLKNNYKIFIISRKENLNSEIPTYKWNPDTKYISDQGKVVLQNADYIIHLAGANIADRRWDENYKRIIIQSRVNSTSFLCELLNHINLEKRPEAVIFASATGYYGDRGDQVLTEQSPPGKGFLAETCIQWEQSSINLHPEIRKIHLRIGFVLDKEYGGFPKMILPVKLFVGAVPGSGKQYVSWIHIDDLVAIFEFFITNAKTKGVYNAVSPQPVTLEEIIKKSANYLNRPIFLPNIPDFFIRTLMGDMSEIILTSSKVIPERLTQEGFNFRFANIDDALKNLLL